MVVEIGAGAVEVEKADELTEICVGDLELERTSCVCSVLGWQLSSLR